MARRTKPVSITAEGRDKGKLFIITEMSARQAEAWAARALVAVGNAGIEIQEGGGMAEIAAQGLRALFRVPWAELKPLLDEMMACVQVQPDPREPLYRRDLVDEGGEGDDIEEVATRVLLRGEVFELHTGFSFAGAGLTSPVAPAPAA